jgi:xyloglucan-specific exo-beta-1,4-glucanase
MPAPATSPSSTILWCPDQSTPYRSTDMAQTWTPCRGLPPDVQITPDPVSSKIFYAIEENGGRFFTSLDGGETFNQTTANLPRPVSRLRVLISPGISPSPSTPPLSPAPGTPGEGRGGGSSLTPETILFPAEDAGLFFSIDGGKSFTNWPQIQQANALGLGAPAPNHTNPTLYLSGEIQNTYGIFRSDDSGKSWIRINDNAHGFGWPHTITGDPRIFGRVYLGTNGRGILYGDPAN